MKRLVLPALIALAWLVPAQADPSTGLDAGMAPLFTQFYSPSQLALITRPGYALTTANLNWRPGIVRPTLLIGYHRAVPFVSHGVTLHFSLVVHHYPESRLLKPSYVCPRDRKPIAFTHPRFGPYLLCARQIVTLPMAGHSGTPLRHLQVEARPRAGNRLPHVTLSLQGFEPEILPLMRALHTYDSAF